MAKPTHKPTLWRDVISISAEQSSENQRLCKDVLDFWQVREPEVFARIAATAEYRSGKLGFGIDLEPENPFTVNGSHFRPLAEKPYINISSLQLKTLIMLDKTGMARRASIEDVAYHELSHAGDKKLLATLKDLSKAAMETRTRVNGLIDEWSKSLEGKTDGKTLVFKRELEEIRFFGDAVTDPAMCNLWAQRIRCMDSPDELLSEKGKKISEEIAKYSARFNQWKEVHLQQEEYTVRLTDQAMQKVDKEFGRVKYDNDGLERWIYNLPEADKIPSYSKKTLKDVTRLLDYKENLVAVQSRAEELEKLTQKPVTDANDLDDIARSIKASGIYLDKTTGINGHKLATDFPSSAREDISIDLKSRRDELYQDAKVMQSQSEFCQQKYAALEKALGEGDKAKIAAAKKSFAEATDNLLSSIENVTTVIQEVKAENPPSQLPLSTPPQDPRYIKDSGR
jgi:hypothetical protein